MSFSIIALGYELLFGYSSYRFIINHEGVQYIKHKKVYSLKWDQVKYVQINSNMHDRYNKYSMICFYSYSFDYPEPISDMKTYNKDIFGVQYRKKIIAEIEKYWDNPIQGIYQVEG